MHGRGALDIIWTSGRFHRINLLTMHLARCCTVFILRCDRVCIKRFNVFHRGVSAFSSSLLKFHDVLDLWVKKQCLYIWNIDMRSFTFVPEIISTDCFYRGEKKNLNGNGKCHPCSIWGALTRPHFPTFSSCLRMCVLMLIHALWICW